MIDAIGYAATGSFFSSLAPMRFKRRMVEAEDVQIEVLFCGVCHSDLHQVKNEWGNTLYPSMPGHEIIGRVSSVGSAVSKYKVGDVVGVGCMIDSCGECRGCQDGLEQYCESEGGALGTYNGPLHPDEEAQPLNTFGGYADTIVVKEKFVLQIPARLDMRTAAPILCAGVTTYSPIRHWGVKAGQKVGVVGLGGLGHMAVKILKAMGTDVTVFTTSEAKGEDIKRLKADAAVLSTDKKAMKGLEMQFDFVLSTIPEKHDVNPYVTLLKRDGVLVMVGALEPLEPINHSEVAFRRRTIAGSLIGGIAETQEVLDFCAEHNIAPDVEMIDIQDINKAYERIEKGEVHYRFVIDMASLKKEARSSAKEAPDKQAAY